MIDNVSYAFDVDITIIVGKHIAADLDYDFFAVVQYISDSAHMIPFSYYRAMYDP